MPNEKYLVFPHSMVGGMTNLLIELEIRVILAELSGRTLVSLNKIPCWPQLDDHIYRRYRSATMLDLFDFPVKHISITKLYKTGFDTMYNLPWEGDCASQAYFRHPSAADFDSGIVDDFKENRQFQWMFPDNECDVWAALNQQRTFCSYSYFFLASESIKRRIRKTISRIQPKAVYLNLAKKIARDLNKYNAIHVRRGDFKEWWVKVPTSKEILANILPIMPTDIPLIICTDNSKDEIFFSAILKAYPKAIFIDDYIMNEYKAELKSLPFDDATVIALLSALVTSDSQCFAGSIFSTFTSSIHRRRLFKDASSPMLFTSNPYGDEVLMDNAEFIESKAGHFSWNRLALPNPPEARANAWFREWPEAVK
jgi:hypothetical protein